MFGGRGDTDTGRAVLRELRTRQITDILCIRTFRTHTVSVIEPSRVLSRERERFCQSSGHVRAMGM